MNLRLLLLMTVSLFTLGVESLAASGLQKYDEYGDETCESEMARLDGYAVEVQNDPKIRAYVVVYGGRRGTRRQQVNARLYRIRRYLIKNRGVEPERVITIDGGFREVFTVQLWCVAKDEQQPALNPTVTAKEVRYAAARKREDVCTNFY